jgi:hypothetical protein
MTFTPKARDANEPQIIAALRSVGATVIPLHTPVDLLVGFRGQTFLLEVKLPLGPRGGDAHSRTTPDQDTFFGSWRGHAVIVRSPLEALRAIGAVLH